MSDPKITSPDGLEQRLQWSQCAGEQAALQGVVSTLRLKAGDLFARGKDEDARLVRELAEQFAKREADASARLDRFIKEGVHG